MNDAPANMNLHRGNTIKGWLFPRGSMMKE